MFARILAFIQRVVGADKAAIVAAGASIVSLLALKFGLKLNASDTAYVASLLAAVVGAFTHMHFAVRGAGKAKGA